MKTTRGFRKAQFTPSATSIIEGIIKRKVALQLSGLSPAERAEVLKNILIERYPDGSSLKVLIASKTATKLEFGTSKNPSRPWIKNLQRNIALPVRAVLAQMLTSKK